MIYCRIDDTPEDAIFTLAELARFLGVTKQYVDYCKRHNSDFKNHFWIRDYPVTILSKQQESPLIKLYRDYYNAKKALKKIKDNQ